MLCRGTCAVSHSEQFDLKRREHSGDVDVTRTLLMAMHSVAFRLFAVNELNLQDIGHVLDGVVQGQSDLAAVQPPGVVNEAGCEPVWTSKPNAPFPLELGLLLLSGPLFTLKNLRVAARSTYSPSQIEVFAPMHSSSQVDALARPDLDLVSRYLATGWAPCCDPLTWEDSESAPLISPHQEVVRTAKLNLPACSVLKFIVHARPGNTRRRPHQVILETIELLGAVRTIVSTENLPSKLRGRENGESTSSFLLAGSTSPVTLLQDENDAEYLETVLLDAGVPLDLVTQVVDFHQHAVNTSPEAVGPAPPSNILPPAASNPESDESKLSEELPEVSPEMPEITSDKDKKEEDTSSEQKEDSDTTSPFDGALRQYVGQRACEMSMLEYALGARISGQLAADDVEWRTPASSLRDPANSNGVALYTFGGFFTQCLLCGASDIQEVCLRTAERYAGVLKQTTDATTTFEGLVSLIALGLRWSQHVQVFRAAMHLARTVFQAKATSVVEPPCPAQISAASVGIGAPFSNHRAADSILVSRSKALGLLEEISHNNWNHGLQLVIEAALSNSRCWSLAFRDFGSKSSISSRNLPADTTKQMGGVPPTIDREFLRFVRMLFTQETTRGAFFNVLVVINSDLQHARCDTRAVASSTTLATNQLRLLRLVVRSDSFRHQIPERAKTSIYALCRGHVEREARTGFFHTRKAPQRPNPENILKDLASDCLEALSGAAAGLNAISGEANNDQRLLDVLHKSLRDQHGKCLEHTALFLDDPLTEDEETCCRRQLQRYFEATPRPDALYHHRFIQPGPSSSGDTPTEPSEWLQKGNIIFRGCVEARELPGNSFHEQVTQKALPFVFDVGGHTPKAASQLSTDQQEIVASFATFRGTIEYRNSSMKRQSKIAPEVNSSASRIHPVKSGRPKGISPREVLAPPFTLKPTTDDPSSLKDPLPANTIATGESLHTDGIPTMADGGENDTPGPRTAERVNGAPAALSLDVGTPPMPEPSPPPPTHRRKSKGKSKGKNDGKDPDNCVLQ